MTYLHGEDEYNAANCKKQGKHMKVVCNPTLDDHDNNNKNNNNNNNKVAK